MVIFAEIQMAHELEGYTLLKKSSEYPDIFCDILNNIFSISNMLDSAHNIAICQFIWHNSLSIDLKLTDLRAFYPWGVRPQNS